MVHGFPPNSVPARRSFIPDLTLQYTLALFFSFLFRVNVGNDSVSKISYFFFNCGYKPRTIFVTNVSYYKKNNNIILYVPGQAVFSLQRAGATLEMGRYYSMIV